MSKLRFSNPIFVAIDTPDLDKAMAVARSAGPHVGGLKIGLEFITAQGPEGIRKIVALGRPVFADVKFHDIPNTVAGATRALARLGAAIFNIHASGGEAMMLAAKDAAASANPEMKIIAVTLLTSLDQKDVAAVGYRGSAAAQVVRLARLAQKSGLDGVVCSAHEITAIRKECGEDFMLVVPGIRPAGADLADQRRVMTPREAADAGADILVIGRPITGAADPGEAARAIYESLI
jgi:orotidine-5'-phosphate decarboxylase